MSIRLSFDKAMEDVSKVYDHPQAICDDARLSDEQKIRLLKQWEYDLRELQVATEENMQGDSGGRNAEVLRAVHSCLEQLHASTKDLSGASKQGG